MPKISQIEFMTIQQLNDLIGDIAKALSVYQRDAIEDMRAREEEYGIYADSPSYRDSQALADDMDEAIYNLECAQQCLENH